MSTRNQRYARTAAYRKEWGPSKGEREIEALSQLADEGFDPQNQRQAATAINERARANQAARGEMAYDQAQGRMVPSARELARRASEDEALASDARGRADEELDRLGVTPSANDFWDDSASMLRNDRAQTRQVATGDGGEVMQIASKRGVATSQRTQEQVDTARANQEQAADRARRFQQALVDNRARANQRSASELTPKLAQLGVQYSPTRKDGSFDTDRAQGLIAKATFQQWDDDKRLDTQAERLAKETRRELRGLRNYQEFMGPRLDPESSRELTNRIVELETDLSEAANRPGGMSEPSYWRMKAESQFRNQSRDAQATKNLDVAANARSMRYKDLAAVLGISVDNILKYIEDGVITPEELAAARRSD